jgi:hypothetical protein
MELRAPSRAVHCVHGYRRDVKILLLPAIALFTACTTEPKDNPEDAGPDATPTVTGVREIDLGTVQSDVAIKFSIPENTLGFHIVVEGINATEQVGISKLTSPSGELAIDGFFPKGSRGAAAGRSGIASASVPQTSFTAAKPVEHGEWAAEFSVASGQPAHAKVFIRSTADGAFHGGALDVRVYIPDGLIISSPSPAHAISASTAATDPDVKARIDSFYATLHDMFQLDRGTVELVSLPSTFASITDINERNDALKLTTGTTPAVHLILVNELVIYNTPIWGISAGIPGTAITSGHALSGIVVDISLGFPAVADGMTMVHELGHFMGLFHTTEQDRMTHDPIDDTPECVAGAAQCPDGNNIMYATFYGATGGVGLTTSEQQRRVVWGSPLYRATE